MDENKFYYVYNHYLIHGSDSPVSWDDIMKETIGVIKNHYYTKNNNKIDKNRYNIVMKSIKEIVVNKIVNADFCKMHIVNKENQSYEGAKYLHEKLICSIKQVGLLIPIIVRIKNDMFIKMDGTNRIGIYGMLGIKTIPAIVLKLEEIKENNR